ncbi:MAG: hypothetical protein U0941_25975 [Planctomycetaceae bacterium]
MLARISDLFFQDNFPGPTKSSWLYASQHAIHLISKINLDVPAAL